MLPESHAHIKNTGSNSSRVEVHGMSDFDAPLAYRDQISHIQQDYKMKSDIAGVAMCSYQVVQYDSKDLFSILQLRFSIALRRAERHVDANGCMICMSRQKFSLLV